MLSISFTPHLRSTSLPIWLYVSCLFLRYGSYRCQDLRELFYADCLRWAHCKFTLGDWEECCLTAYSTCIASIMRVISLQAVTGDGHVDFSYNTVGGLNWCIVEVGTAILCSSLSSIRPLLAKYLPKIFNHTTANISTKQSKSNQKGKAFKLGDFSSTGKSGDTTGWKNDTEMGEIVVEQTFDVKEEWDPRNEKRESTWGRIRGDRSSKKIEMVTKEKRSDSEEVLVIQSNNLPYPCPGRPI